MILAVAIMLILLGFQARKGGKSGRPYWVAAGALAALAEWARARSPEVALDFDGYRFEWPDWWFNVRPSNTEPYLRLVAEARTPALLDERVAALRAILAPFIG